MKVNAVVKSNQPPEDLPRLRITSAEIAEVKRRHILQNLLYSYEEAGQILGKSVRVVQELVKDGKLIAADGNAKKGRHGLQASTGIRITAESLEFYRNSILIAAEDWTK